MTPKEIIETAKVSLDAAVKAVEILSEQASTAERQAEKAEKQRQIALAGQETQRQTHELALRELEAQKLVIETDTRALKESFDRQNASYRGRLAEVKAEVVKVEADAEKRKKRLQEEEADLRTFLSQLSTNITSAQSRLQALDS